MIAVLSLNDWYKFAGVIIAVPVAIALVWGIARMVSHMMLVHEAIIGRPAAAWSDGIPSMVERFNTQDAALAELRAGQVEIDTRLIVVEGEFRTNGGSTVKDDLAGLKVAVASLRPPPRKRAVAVKKVAAK